MVRSVGRSEPIAVNMSRLSRRSDRSGEGLSFIAWLSSSAHRPIQPGADGVFAYRSHLCRYWPIHTPRRQGRIGSRQDMRRRLRTCGDHLTQAAAGSADAAIRNASAAMIAQQALPSGEPGGVILLLNVMPFSVPCGLGKKRCGACVTYMCRSSDNGATWSSLTPLRDVSTHGSGVGNGIVLRSGRLLAPRRADCCDCSGVPRSYVLISDDHALGGAGAKLPRMDGKLSCRASEWFGGLDCKSAPWPFCKGPPGEASALCYLARCWGDVGEDMGLLWQGLGR